MFGWGFEMFSEISHPDFVVFPSAFFDPLWLTHDGCNQGSSILY